jgi:D-alanyl-D-alanine carboxypeptidase
MREKIFHSAWIRDDGTTGFIGSASGLFPWWSFTKSVLAICALRLVEEGQLDLDVSRAGEPYTLRHLLQHRAGVPNYGRLKAYHDAVARNDVPWSREHLLETVGVDRLDFPPGTGWAYSNVGYMFVRDAIEETTGLHLAAALQELVLGPLEVSSVRLAIMPADFREVFWPALRNYDPRWVYHGCLIGTPIDAARVLNALVRGKILQPTTLHTMMERHELGGAVSDRPWTACGYGLGLMSGLMGASGRAIGHSGGGPGCVNAVYHFPDVALPTTVAAFTDGDDEGPAEFEAASVAGQTA